MAPTEVATASAKEPYPSLCSTHYCFQPLLHLFRKIPVRRPVPIKVPIVSKTSDKLNAKIVMITEGFWQNH